MGLGFLFVGWTSGIRMVEVSFESIPWLPLALSALAVFSFVFFFAIDLLYLIIPDHVSVPLIALGLFGSLATNPLGWKDYLVAGILGASFFALQYAISRGTWVGGGDIRLGALLGVLLGLEKLVLCLVAAYVLGMVVALILLALKKANLKTAVPFGVFLMTGGFISFFFGTSIVSWYVNDLPRIFGSIFF
jgi:prepilin signal peptidase PulO-like enzyme (type II secretory pathway)